LSTTYFEGQPTLQYGRRLWLPARSRLFTWQPVLVPDHSSAENDRLQFHSLVLETSGSVERVARDSAQMLDSGFLPLSLETATTALVDGRDDERPDLERDSAHQLVVAARVSQRLHADPVSFPGQRFAPGTVSFSPDDASWQSLQQLVVADGSALDDPAGLAAIRRWVHAGGRLWVMLDRVEPRFLERILGDEFLCDVVDRVRLTTVRIEPASTEIGAPAVESEYEQPVDLARVMVSDVDVAYTVNGWPAAFWKSFGAGRVLVTTLAPRGWMRARTAADAELADPPPSTARLNLDDANRFVPLAPMVEIAKDFLTRPSPPSKIPQLLEPQAREYIGYSIPPRWLIVSLLGGLAAAVVILANWLGYRHALQSLAWISSGLALCVAAALLLIGGLNRHAIPMTAATVELVEAIPGTDDVRTQGAVALYNPEASTEAIRASHGGRLIPDMMGLEGSTKRMVWSDLDSWSWDRLALGGGERLGTFLQSEALPERFEARATFGPDGLSGRASMPGITAPGDALIATRLGRLGIALQPNGEFQAAAASVFGQGQYLAAGLLSDEQDRRRRAFSQVVPELFNVNSSDHPLLLVWADSRNSGFEFGEGRRLRGASLLAIPLALDRPSAHTQVRIPAPFLPFRSARPPDGRPPTPLWNSRRQEWVERSGPASAWLRFQLPVELLPVKLTRARLVISVAGPVGRIEVSALRRSNNRQAAERRDEVVSVKTWHAPVGTLSPAEIVDSDLLHLDDDGGLLLGLAAGDPGTPEAKVSQTRDGSKISFWRIEQLSLELFGTIAP
jgi:hypothetical protein